MTKTEAPHSISDKPSTSRATHRPNSQTKPATPIPGFPFLSLATLAISGCLVLYGRYYEEHGLSSNYCLLVSDNALATIEESESMESAKAREIINHQVVVFERLLAASLDPNRLLEYHRFLTSAVAKLESLPDQDAPDLSAFHRLTRGRIDEILLLIRQSESSTARAYAKFCYAQRMLLSFPLSLEYLSTTSAELKAAALELSKVDDHAKKDNFQVETAQSIREFAQWLSRNQKHFTVDSNDPFSFHTYDSSKSDMQTAASLPGRPLQEIEKNLAEIESLTAEADTSGNERTQSVLPPSSPWKTPKHRFKNETLFVDQLDQLDSHVEYSDWSGFSEILGEVLQSQPLAQQNFGRRLCIAMLLRVCLETDGPQSGRDLARAGVLCFQIGAGTPKVNALLFHTAKAKLPNQSSEIENAAARPHDRVDHLTSFSSALDSEPGNPCTLITKVIQFGLESQFDDAEQVLDSMMLIAPETIPMIASIALWRANDVSNQANEVQESPETWLKLLELVKSRTKPVQSAEYARLRWLILGSRYEDALSEARQLTIIYPEAAWVYQITEEATRKMEENSSDSTSPKIDQDDSEAVQIDGKQNA